MVWMNETIKGERFDAAKVRDALVKGVRELAEKQGFTRAVVGISGGKDSAVVAAILCRALGKENVYGLLLPDGEQSDIADSLSVVRSLGMPYRVVNIHGMHEALLEQADPERRDKAEEQKACQAGEFAVAYSRESDINVCPRLRMTALRYFAQALGARLAGTGNLSEATVGYCTKDGDTSCDFAVLLRLTSLEVVAVGKTLAELPQEIVQKTPSDGLSGLSDEEKMGISYQAIHDYIRNGTSGSRETDEAIRRREKAGAHKRTMPPVIDPFA